MAGRQLDLRGLIPAAAIMAFTLTAAAGRSGLALGRRHERHAAFRTIAGARARDFRVHRADMIHVRCRRFGGAARPVRSIVAL